MADVPSHPFQHLFTTKPMEKGFLNDHEPAFTDIVGERPVTVTGTLSSFVHNCILHPVMGGMYLVGDVLRLTSSRTAPVGERIIALAEALHEL